MNDNINELTPIDFPPLLSETPRPPKKLFYRGTLPNWNKFKMLSVVGSRKYSSYGKEVCERLIEGISGFPIIIVSGLALGVDAIAHRAALKAGLTTLAVPGSGLGWDTLYPASHVRLAEEIIEHGGALISEFEAAFRATPWSFPQRNRIMAGMSHAVLVIEAEIKSGTLITSKLATEYNRDVLTVPGSIFSPTSQGPHMLLRMGATPITSSKDLLEALRFESAAPGTIRNYSDCSNDELQLIELLDEPLSREDIINAMQKPAYEINALISLLEIKGHIKESGSELHKVIA